MATTDNAAPQEKRSLFDSIILSTPVMLTVVATFILGRSTSEMTQAQYQRAVASQKQSKVGDQWAFFQAKRIRGSTYEATAISLYAQKSEPFTRESLQESAQELVRQIDLADKDPGGHGAEYQTLRKKAEAAGKQVDAALNPPKEGLKIKRTLLTDQNVKTALDALEHYPEFKSDADEPDDVDAEQRKTLDEILDDIRKFKAETDVNPKTLKLKPETIDKAIEKAKQKAAKVAEHGKSIDRVLEEFDALVDRQTALGAELQRILAAQLADAKKANSEVKDLDKLRVRRLLARNHTANLLASYKAARYAFDARRYEDDARSNQDQAYLYEVVVARSSAQSDKHLKRSFLFMIAMLIAQIGVTIASVAMMLKYRLPVWAIAAFAGIIAISFGLAVFLELAPLMDVM